MRLLQGYEEAVDWVYDQPWVTPLRLAILPFDPVVSSMKSVWRYRWEPLIALLGLTFSGVLPLVREWLPYEHWASTPVAGVLWYIALCFGVNVVYILTYTYLNARLALKKVGDLETRFVSADPMLPASILRGLSSVYPHRTWTGPETRKFINKLLTDSHFGISKWILLEFMAVILDGHIKKDENRASAHLQLEMATQDYSRFLGEHRKYCEREIYWLADWRDFVTYNLPALVVEVVIAIVAARSAQRDHGLSFPDHGAKYSFTESLKRLDNILRYVDEEEVDSRSSGGQSEDPRLSHLFGPGNDGKPACRKLWEMVWGKSCESCMGADCKERFYLQADGSHEEQEIGSRSHDQGPAVRLNGNVARRGLSLLHYWASEILLEMLYTKPELLLGATELICSRFDTASTPYFVMRHMREFMNVRQKKTRGIVIGQEGSDPKQLLSWMTERMFWRKKHSKEEVLSGPEEFWNIIGAVGPRLVHEGASLDEIEFALGTICQFRTRQGTLVTGVGVDADGVSSGVTLADVHSRSVGSREANMPVSSDGFYCLLLYYALMLFRFSCGEDEPRRVQDGSAPRCVVRDTCDPEGLQTLPAGSETDYYFDFGLYDDVAVCSAPLPTGAPDGDLREYGDRRLVVWRTALKADRDRAKHNGSKLDGLLDHIAGKVTSYFGSHPEGRLSSRS